MLLKVCTCTNFFTNSIYNSGIGNTLFVNICLEKETFISVTVYFLRETFVVRYLAKNLRKFSEKRGWCMEDKYMSKTHLFEWAKRFKDTNVIDALLDELKSTKNPFARCKHARNFCKDGGESFHP